jgi:hypothetical protein
VAAEQIGSSDAPALVDNCDSIGHCLLLSVPSGLPREPTPGSVPTSQRHGFFSCYEAFVHFADSMFNQHAKWLESASEIAWRRPIASLNYLLTSHVWRQDHNGLSHQDPGFVDHVANKKAEIVQVYLPGRSVARGVEEGSKQLLHFDDQANMCHPRESGDPAVGTRRSGDVSQEAVVLGAKRQAL